MKYSQTVNLGQGEPKSTWKRIAGIVGWSGTHEVGKRPTGVHELALVGAPPESRDWMVGDPFFAPEIASDALVDAFCTVDAGLDAPTRIGKRSWLQKRVHVGHDAVIGDDCEVCVGVTICGRVTVGDGARIGGNSWIKPRVKIGAGAIIGGGSVVTKDVPAHEVWCGNPARFLKKADTHPELGYETPQFIRQAVGGPTDTDLEQRQRAARLRNDMYDFLGDVA